MIGATLKTDPLLTQRGYDLLTARAVSPTNPQRYVRAVLARVKNPDPVTLSYLDDAVGAWRDGHARASAVMLGCACENLVYMLSGAIVAAKYTPWSDKLRKELSSKRPPQVSSLFDEVHAATTHAATVDDPPHELADAHERILTSVFEYARILRNASGHPTGKVITLEEAEGGLILFPRFYEICDGWTRFFIAKVVV